MNTFTLEDFVRESNRIEGIVRKPTRAEMKAHNLFLGLEDIRVADLEGFVAVCQPGAVLRRKVGMNVHVGDYVAPMGGRNIEIDLIGILSRKDQLGPYLTHIEYEQLHPFTDGNGRSGRALWLWQMRNAPLGFLHHFYYQTLNKEADMALVDYKLCNRCGAKTHYDANCYHTYPFVNYPERTT
jgi:hypothetical protein